MTGSADLKAKRTLSAQGSLLNLDVDSPRSTTSHNPTKDQVLANGLSRCIELSTAIGSPVQAVVLNQALQKSDLDSDEATESAIVSVAAGNASGLISALLIHYYLKKTNKYRTGEYQVQLKAAAPTAEEQAEMKVSQACVYLNADRKLSYFVKQSATESHQDLIDLDDAKAVEEKETREELNQLKQELEGLRPGVAAPALGSTRKKAFLSITHKRRHTFSGRTSTNPLYRACKTLSAFGARLGAVISLFIGADNPNHKRIISYIMSDICCVVFGVFGIFYFLVRDKILKIPPNTKKKYHLTGMEGWSKYAKTALTFGTAVGQGVGGLFVAIANAASSSAAAVTSFSISFWGGVVGVGSFIISLIFVPLINWISSKFTRDGKGILTSDNKNKFRNNYARSGLTLGAGGGAALGLLIGNWCFGLIMAATIFSAIGAVFGAVAISVYGYRIHRYLHGKLPQGKTDNDEDLENSWDYVTRCTASVFGFIGAAVVCAINPAMALLLVPIGTAIASAIGWGLGLLIMKRARSLPGNNDEKKSATLPWTQRITMGANVGSIVGGCIGLAVGLAGFVLGGGPAGVIFAVSLFGAIGAVVGGVLGALYDPDARSLIWQAINPWSSPRPVSRQSSGSGPELPMSPQPQRFNTAEVLPMVGSEPGDFKDEPASLAGAPLMNPRGPSPLQPPTALRPLRTSSSPDPSLLSPNGEKLVKAQVTVAGAGSQRSIWAGVPPVAGKPPVSAEPSRERSDWAGAAPVAAC